MRRLAALAAGLWLALLAGGPASAADRAPIEVTIDQTALSTELGGSTVVAVKVANLGETLGRPMTAHLSIVDPRLGRPVDPEDWTDQLSRPIASLAGGEFATLEWTLKPITEGQYALFVSLVPTAPQRGDAPLNSPVVNVSVRPRAVDPTGAVVVAVVVPVVIGAILVSQSILNRRRRSRSQRPRPTGSG